MKATNQKCCFGKEKSTIGNSVDFVISVKDAQITEAAGFEHYDIAENVELRMLLLPNGVQIKYSDIIALAGDHYGIPGQPVVDPSNWEMDEVDSGRDQRFLNAYNTLARTPKDEIQDELQKLIAVLDKEIKKGKPASDYDWDKITGGFWVFGLPIKHGRMMRLAENNFDHFLPYAKDAYMTGHKLAIDKAREAARDVEGKVNKLLHEAMSLDAFACHFLTDSFASGHLRVPRMELPKATFIKLIGDLLSKYMHDEDGTYGLRVTNARGDKWIAYGDGQFLEEKNKKNFDLVTEAVQKSISQVKEAFHDPSVTIDPAEVTELIPFVDHEEKNNYPLFQVKDGKMHRRKDINNLQDPNTVSNWWGATTASKLQWGYQPQNSAI